jgi:uncharacterized membrane protein
MSVHKFVVSLIVALAVVPLSASVGHASFTICNHSSETLFVMFVVPSDACESGQQHNLSLLSPTTCVTPYAGSAQDETFYYRAWSQTSDMKWDGTTGMWIPDTDTGEVDGTDNNPCMPIIRCHPSSGNRCGDGEVYNMRQKTGTKTDKTINLIP